MRRPARPTQTSFWIDTPPTVDRCMIFAAAAAHMVVIPTRSNVLDRFALKDTLTYMDHIGALWKSVVVLNAPSKGQKSARGNRGNRLGFPMSRCCRTSSKTISILPSPSARAKGSPTRWPKRKAATAIRTIYRQLCEHERTLGPRQTTEIGMTKTSTQRKPARAQSTKSPAKTGSGKEEGPGQEESGLGPRRLRRRRARLPSQHAPVSSGASRRQPCRQRNIRSAKAARRLRGFPSICTRWPRRCWIRLPAINGGPCRTWGLRHSIFCFSAMGKNRSHNL